MLTRIRPFAWVAPLLLSVGLLVGGIVAVNTAIDTRDEVQSEIISENIVTAGDASIPNVVIDSPAKAQAQAEAIKEHSLHASDGKTYAEMDRDDPARQTYLTGVNLRTSLNTYVMAYRLTEFVQWFGLLLIAGGLITLFVGVPTVYTVTRD